MAQGTGSAPKVGPQLPHVVPGQTGSHAPLDFYIFSWDEFLALNWPALVPEGDRPRRGVPDISKKPGDLGMPRVWETWKADYELYLDQTGHARPLLPTAWSSWDLPVQICSSSDGATRVVSMGIRFPSVNQEMGGPLVDQHGKYVRYETRINEQEYNETVGKGWYLRKNLAEYPKPANLFTASTPDRYGAIELQAGWRIMTPQESAANPPRYYISKARVVDPKTHQCSDQPVDVGLVGFHIAHKTGPFDAWVWSTFEQVDNVPSDGVPAPALGYSFNNGMPPNRPLKLWGFAPKSAATPVDTDNLKPEPATPVEVIRLNPIQMAIATLNNQVHQMTGVKGTVWENYELVETQWQLKFPQPVQVNNPNTSENFYSQLDGFPANAVANTSMEPFYQGFKGNPPNPARNALGLSNMGTSCLNCHYTAAQYDFSWVMASAAWPHFATQASSETREGTAVQPRQNPSAAKPSSNQSHLMVWEWACAVCLLVLLTILSTRLLLIVLSWNIPPIPQVADIFFETPFGRWTLYRTYRRKFAAEMAGSTTRFVDIPFEARVSGKSLPLPEKPLSKYVGAQLQERSVVVVSDSGRGKTALCELTAGLAAQGGLRFNGDRREPVIIRGTGFNGDILATTVAELCFRGAWVSMHTAELQIKAGNLLLILDGVSEMNPDQLAGLATSLKALGAQTYLAVSRSDLPPLLTAALGEREQAMSVRLLDVSGEAELRFYTIYTGKEDKAKRLQDEITRRFPTLPRTPLLMKLVATGYNETGQVPSSLGRLFEAYLADLVGRAKTETADQDGLLFAIRQLTKETFLKRGGARRGFSEERGIEILGAVASDLKNRDVTASPQKILRLLCQAGIYVDNRHYFSAAHDLLEDYFGALVLDSKWEDEERQIIVAYRSNPKLKEVWEFLRQLRPEVDSWGETEAGMKG